MSTDEQTETHSPWTDRRFQIFGIGNLLKNIGNATYSVTMPLLAYDLTESLAVMSVFALLLPLFSLLGPFVGVIVDNRNASTVSLFGALGAMAGAIGLLVIVIIEPAPLVLWILACALIGQAANEFYRTGWIAGVPRLFPEFPGRARAALSSLFIASTMIGPLVVALLVVPIGYDGLLTIHAVSCLAPIVVWLSGTRVRDNDQPSSRRRIRFWADLHDGWQVVRNEKRVLLLNICLLPLLLGTGAGMGTFMVWFLRDVWLLSDSHTSYIQTGVQVAALLGSFIVAALS
ncbi:MFS transporter [Haloglycomyces albus]|uniref:MFS transporter n=1 Tax=Haloglycomyces albus TaxID=526067 RepID=UPI00046D2A42|nr:MFS transporter [Haloglycomyces albus]